MLSKLLPQYTSVPVSKFRRPTGRFILSLDFHNSYWAIYSKMPKNEKLPTSVIVHPLVLLSAVDHFTRLGTRSTQRVVGVLLGSVSDGVVDVMNSYAGM